MRLILWDVLGPVYRSAPSLSGFPLIQNLGAYPSNPCPAEKRSIVIWLPKSYRMQESATAQIHIWIGVANFRNSLFQYRGCYLLRAFTVLYRSLSGHISSPSPISKDALGSSALNTPCPNPYIGLRESISAFTKLATSFGSEVPIL